MGKKKKELGFDSDGAKKVMRKRDYMADMSGQWALGLMANVVWSAYILLYRQGGSCCWRCRYCDGNR